MRADHWATVSPEGEEAPGAPDGPTSLYRYYGANGELLYVGITASIPTRFTTHAQTSPWYLEVGNVTVVHFETRSGALEAERLAIQSESPKYNVQHSTSRRKTEKVVTVDDRGRVSLRGMELSEYYRAVRSDDGTITLTPVVYVLTKRLPNGLDTDWT